MIVNYNESILTYVSSIRSYFGLSSSYKENLVFSKYINSLRPNKIFLVLIDGMGANLVERKLSTDSFLRKNMYKKVMTVFPSTTTAAVTSISNGKSPNENAWLAWQEYIKEIDDIVIPFLGRGYYNDKEYGKNLVYDLIPFKKTDDELNEIGINALELYPDFIEGGCKDLEDFSRRLIDLSYSNNKYVFAYWDKYDSIMHKNGPDSLIADKYLKEINDYLYNTACNLNKDTLMVIVADHGQVSVQEPYYLKGSKYEKYMYRLPVIELRSPGFYIKDEFKDEFEIEFNKDFKNDFVLINKKQIIETNLFGEHKNHERFIELLPDYLAIGKSDKCIAFEKRDEIFKGQHAGIHEDELYIPIITYKR